jgi:hypothetical protein
MAARGSEIVHHAWGGTTFAGLDAVNLFRAVHVASALRVYARTGMKMTRGATPSVLLAIAREYTGKTYKRGEYLQAAEDVRVWVETMKAALPVTVEGRPV